VRSSTRNIVTSIGLGTLAMSYVIGMNSTTAGGYSAGGAGGGAAAPSTVPVTAPSMPSGDGEGDNGPKSAPSTAPTQSSNPAPSTSATKKAPKPAASSSSSSASSGTANTGSATVTKSGGVINYQFGAVQVSVTKVGGKITAVDLLQAGATHGRQGAFGPLVQAAIQAQGSSFGNLSGATYTTDAFKQALDSALSKF